jgi:ATP-dependent DNA helicase RecG
MDFQSYRGSELGRLVLELKQTSHELEWVEFKENNADPQEIGEYVSALSNAAALHGESRAFLVWGVEDGTHRIVGTTFSPGTARRGGEQLASWLSHMLTPRIDFLFHQGTAEEKPVVVLEIPAAQHMPTRFAGEEYIPIGSSKKKLKDFPEKERKLWHRFTRVAFEDGIACADQTAAEVLTLLDFAEYFELSSQAIPKTPDAIINRLRDEGLITRNASGRYDVTNLGAIAFGKPLRKLGLDRKAVRVVIYRGEDRFEATREQEGGRGYVTGFKGLMQFINAQLPANELIGQALRRDEPMYPELAVRELVANALIHQDFSLSGTGPMVEIFDGRIEVTNPGRPLIDPQRFLDAPPRSRNEKLASLMRRFGICEERGSGIDKVIRLAEVYQLPAPDFRVTPEHTVAVLYAPRPLAAMNKDDRIRACYQHAGLRWVAHKELTNASLRERFGISDANSAIASRIIGETLDAGLIKPHDPENKSRKHARYLPFWAA